MLDRDRVYELIGERMREVRETQTPRMSQGDLAKILGLKRTSVTNIEKGKQRPTLDTLYRLCEHFRLSIGDFIPAVVDVSHSDAREVVVAGRTLDVGAKTASAVERLRSLARSQQ